MEELNQGTVDFRSGFQSLLGVCRALLQRGLAPSASAAGSRHTRLLGVRRSGGMRRAACRHHLSAAAGRNPAGSFLGVYRCDS